MGESNVNAPSMGEDSLGNQTCVAPALNLAVKN